MGLERFYKKLENKKQKLSMVADTSNSSIQELEAGGLH